MAYVSRPGRLFEGLVEDMIDRSREWVGGLVQLGDWRNLRWRLPSLGRNAPRRPRLFGHLEERASPVFEPLTLPLRL